MTTTCTLKDQILIILVTMIFVKTCIENHVYWSVKITHICVLMVPTPHPIDVQVEIIYYELIKGSIWLK